jgi:pimeloyl-ACP methyl ester carboxylesterase
MIEAPRYRGGYPVRVLAILGVICFTLWTGAVGCLWVNEARLVFSAHRSRVLSPVAYRSGLIELKNGDGIELDALTLTAARSTDYWILFCPPAAGTIHGRLQSQLEALQSLGYNVFAFDYRGFGRNAGTPSETGLYDDALTAYRYLTGEMRVPPSRVILAGRSLGSAVAVETATRVPSAGLLLLSALDSVPAAAGRIYRWAPVHWLASQRFDSLTKAASIQTPVVMVHALNDRLIPMDAARDLFSRFQGPKLMLEARGGHNRAGLSGLEDLGQLSASLARFWPTGDGEDDVGEVR